MKKPNKPSRWIIEYHSKVSRKWRPSLLNPNLKPCFFDTEKDAKECLYSIPYRQWPEEYRIREVKTK